MYKQQENIMMFLVGTILAFLIINFDLRIGVVFFSLLVIEWLAYHSNMFEVHPFLRKGETALAVLIYIMIGFVIYIYGSMLLLSVTGISLSFASFIKFASQETIPALSGDPAVTNFVLMFIGPVVESRFFIRVAECFGMIFKIKIIPNIKSLAQWGLFAFVSGCFSIFHLTVKMSSDIGMILTFTFMMVSLWLVAYRKQTAEAIGIHVLNNSVVIMLRNGVLGV